MKIFVLFAILFFASSSDAARKSKSSLKTLSDLYDYGDNYVKTKANENHPLYVIYNTCNRECVKEKLKLPANSGKQIDKVYGGFLISAAFDLCSNKREETSGEHFKMISNKFDDSFRNKLECFKYKLRELEPRAEIVKNYTPVGTLNNEVECKNAGDLVKNILTANKEASSVFCDLETSEALSNLGYRLAIIKFGSLNSELKNAEIKNAKQKLSKLLENTYTCLIKLID